LSDFAVIIAILGEVRKTAGAIVENQGSESLLEHGV
jgi:hypothetical protein